VIPLVKLKVYHVFVLIPVIYILVVSIFPTVYMMAGSFTDWKLGIAEMPFVGVKNYVDSLQDYRLYNSLWVIFYLNIMAVPLEIALGIFLAQLMALRLRGRRLFRTMFLLPVFTSPVAVAVMGNIIFYENGGPLNGMLNLLNLSGIPWRSSTTVAPLTVVLCDVWMWTPFCFLITLAGIEAIPREYTEAAVVDGASLFEIFRRINLPLISAPLVTILMFRVLDGLKIFEIPMILVGGGGPGIVTETLTIYIYKTAFRGFFLGRAAAMSLIFMVIIAVLSGFFISRVRKYYV